MRIAITGTTGTLGKALVRHAEAAGHTLLHLNRPQHDITDPTITSAITTFKPDVVIHPAAYTNVDGAESEPDAAFAVNAQGTRNVAIACEAAGSPLIYVSTNMVFDGTKGSPYLESDTPNPRGVYATSKWEGETHVKEALTRHYIARVSWLYGKDGDSFIHKIIRAADTHGKLTVVADEIATPTYAEDLAEALLKLALTERYGIYHLVNEGECSRYEYAAEIMRLTNRAHIAITPTALANFNRPAYTPPHSTLLNTVGAQAGIALRPWQDALADYLRNSQF
ncbi:MAG TPA: dTDP-4-dehydrorhamnose reductase [Chloroflexia bacterium]|nr:dTDP-4-dehydrorhamnose reductase [Chloroflexia bacterium]